MNGSTEAFIPLMPCTLVERRRKVREGKGGGGERERGILPETKETKNTTKITETRVKPGGWRRMLG